MEQIADAVLAVLTKKEPAPKKKDVVISFRPIGEYKEIDVEPGIEIENVDYTYNDILSRYEGGSALCVWGTPAGAFIFRSKAYLMERI